MLLLWHWFMHYSGADNGKWYPWWSGPGSDLGELTLLVAMVAYFRGHSCHVKGCWRHGRHPYRHYMLCAKHHPDVPSAGITHEHIRALKAGEKAAECGAEAATVSGGVEGDRAAVAGPR